MNYDLNTRRGSILITGALAGLAGGTAEMAWISVLAATGGTSVEAVAKGVAATISPSLSTSTSGDIIGIAIHLVLAMALGAAMLLLWSLFLRDKFSQWWSASFAITTLAVVWAVNFHLVLPVINPEFLGLVPAGLGLISKLFFALALLAASRVLTAQMNRPRPERKPF